uniref:Uncharacterized protein n=1 Tax=Arundo donax TaxID=35708 RepID=A0A0A9CZC4_ARUDO
MTSTTFSKKNLFASTYASHALRSKRPLPDEDAEPEVEEEVMAVDVDDEKGSM